MARAVGTVSRGIRTPIVTFGDDLVKITVNSILNAAKNEGFEIKDRDIIGITESLLARAQGNYVLNKTVAQDIKNKFPGPIGIVFPILSRNRFMPILKSIVLSGRDIVLLLSYPADEVGNHLMEVDDLINSKVNPYTDLLTEEEYREIFGDEVLHPFTGIDYVSAYRDICGDKMQIYFSNDPTRILDYVDDVLVANVHDREKTINAVKQAGGNVVLGLADIMDKPLDGSAYNPEYGLLGANLATPDEIKLFPRNSQEFVEEVQSIIKEKTGKTVEVMIYGDGAFKDPVGKIWELADPVVSPGFTSGLVGTPSEIKLKYIVDTDLRGLRGEELNQALRDKILSDKDHAKEADSALGTTPRQLTDLLGTLCDLTSGSGDKGTPIVYIQGYFDNFASE